MRKPDFFIVGAPKCGTTAMYEYLKQHPEIFMPRIKELNFWGQDLTFRFGKIKKDEYLSLFHKVRNEKRVGEVCIWSLYSKSAPLEIKGFSPSAKIIIMLRNPVEMIYAMHSQFLFDGHEDIKNFKDALEAEEDRKRRLRIPKGCQLVEGLFYREVAKFSEQVKRYFGTFGRENVHIIIFDDFKADTSKVYKETLRFLGVDDSFMPEFKVINPNKVVRSLALRDFLSYPPPIVRTLGKNLIPKPLRRLITRSLYRINTKYVPRPPMDPELRRQLQEEFRPEVERLSKLLGRDLTHWVKK